MKNYFKCLCYIKTQDSVIYWTFLSKNNFFNFRYEFKMNTWNYRTFLYGFSDFFLLTKSLLMLVSWLYNAILKSNRSANRRISYTWHSPLKIITQFGKGYLKWMKCPGVTLWPHLYFPPEVQSYSKLDTLLRGTGGLQGLNVYTFKTVQS